MRFTVVLRLEVFLCTYSFCCIFCRQGVCINFNLSLFLSLLRHCLSFYTSISLTHIHSISPCLFPYLSLILSVCRSLYLSIYLFIPLPPPPPPHTPNLPISLPRAYIIEKNWFAARQKDKRKHTL